MKRVLLVSFILLFTITNAQTPCVNGMAGIYPCSGFNLQSRISLSTMNTTGANDSWGWKDSQNGKEYALVGLEDGTAFIDISNPTSPIYLGKLPTHTTSSTWRDIKTYNDYAFIVSEAFDHGMQVFDLTRLRNVTNPPVNFTEDAHYDGFGNAHNIVINEDTGYAYGVGTNTYSGGSHFVNIQDPLNPIAAGGYANDGYTHDAQVILYSGPDQDYNGHEILVSSSGNEQAVTLVDVTDKNNPQGISLIGYTNVGYTHQGWFTDDHKYFLLGDEFDEGNVGFNTRTIIFDFTDLDNPLQSFEFFGTTTAIDHNGYVKGNEYYLANYAAGLRVMDIDDIENGNMSEKAFFDTYPADNNASYNGAWNVYPYFESGNVMITDRSGGFFLVRASSPDVTDPVAVCQNISIPLGIDGSILVNAAQIDGGSNDNSGFYSLELSQNSFDCSNVGDNTVVLTVTDPNGNKDTCIAIITILDNIDPIVNCPSNSTVSYDTGNAFYSLPNYITNGLVTATDNCTTNPTITQDPAPGTQLTEGVYTISFESMDDSNNIGECSFQLTVVEVLNIDDFNFEAGLSIFPVPASEMINIISKTNKINSVRIIDISGKEIYFESTYPSNNKTIDVSTFSEGLYFITINNTTKKIIIK